MEMSKEFLEDEVRCGFYIPAMIKKAWSCSIQILEQIDNICKKHDIKYYAEWGTLLGTVRHGGFIPWDDDFDIGMMRKDYTKFCEVALKELPEGYGLQNFHEDPEFDLFLARVTSNTHISFEEKHLRQFNGFPYMIGIDIFVTDYVYADEEKEQRRVKLCKKLIAMGDAIHDGEYGKSGTENLIREVEKLANIKIDRDVPVRQQILMAVEKIFAEVPENEADEVVQLFPWGLMNKARRYPKDCYKDLIELPYEYTNIPVPVTYDMMLKKRYGEYMKIVKNVAGHDYPFFAKQKEDLEKTMGFMVPDFIEPQYRIPQNIEDVVSKKVIDKSNSYKVQIKGAMEQMEENHLLIKSGESDILNMLSECQNLALAVGNVIEYIKGQGHRAISYLENYCEKIYELYSAVEKNNGVSDNMCQELQLVFQEMCTVIQDTVINRKDVVFMPFKAEYWNGLEGEWQKAKQREDCDVYVVPLPYFYKNYDGSMGDTVYEPEKYPEKLRIIGYEDYNPELIMPDEIYIQNPYDAYNPSITVPEYYYSENLRMLTDKLIYVPYFRTDEFEKNNYCEWLNMKYYCTVPGVVYADRVLVQSDNIKKQYVAKLIEECGEETRQIWEEKIDISDNNEGKVFQTKSGKKVICYYSCVSTFVQYGWDWIKKVQDNINTFHEHRDKITLIWKIQPQLMEYVDNHDNEICRKFRNILEEYVRSGWGVLDMETDFDTVFEQVDAYYGDADSCVLKFNRAGKYVMLQEIMV